MQRDLCQSSGDWPNFSSSITLLSPQIEDFQKISPHASLVFEEFSVLLARKDERDCIFFLFSRNVSVLLLVNSGSKWESRCTLIQGSFMDTVFENKITKSHSSTFYFHDQYYSNIQFVKNSQNHPKISKCPENVLICTKISKYFMYQMKLVFSVLFLSYTFKNKCAFLINPSFLN